MLYAVEPHDVGVVDWIESALRADGILQQFCHVPLRSIDGVACSDAPASNKLSRKHARRSGEMIAVLAHVILTVHKGHEGSACQLSAPLDRSQQALS